MESSTPSEQLYCQAARFTSMEKAGDMHTPLQQLILEAQDDCDHSAFRFQITEGWHVVILGEQPPAELHEHIEALLKQGTPVDLQTTRPDVVSWLQDRRAKATKIAPWVEVHYNPHGE